MEPFLALLGAFRRMPQRGVVGQLCGFIGFPRGAAFVLGCLAIMAAEGSPLEFEIPFLGFDASTGPKLVGEQGRLSHLQLLAGEHSPF